ncbi:MAG: biopolymer transporter ExbD [bacterium]
MNLATPSRLVEDGNVDVTPVMNMFIILIPFLVSMAVFSHLSVLEFSLPADGGTGRIKDPESLPITVAMTSNELAVTRGEFILASLPILEGPDSGYDFAALTAALAPLAQLAPTGTDSTVTASYPQNIVIAIDDGVLFADIVDCMDHCRHAGFMDVGLAAGTNLDRTKTADPAPGVGAGGSDAAH